MEETAGQGRKKEQCMEWQETQTESNDSKIWKKALKERYSEEMYEAAVHARVAIAGLGGLGSHVAVMLARAGVGKLFLADFDRVEVTNLNRQAYRMSQIGKKKTEALAELLREINPCLDLEMADCRVTEKNAGELFGTYPIVCEAFDKPKEKAMLVNTLLKECPDTVVVAGSGMAGIGPANEIVTTHPMRRLYVCGDGTTELRQDVCLMASRVTLCAAHQANTILRLIFGLEERKKE